MLTGYRRCRLLSVVTAVEFLTFVSTAVRCSVVSHGRYEVVRARRVDRKQITEILLQIAAVGHYLLCGRTLFHECPKQGSAGDIRSTVKSQRVVRL